MFQQRILVVDDEEETRNLCQRILSREAYFVQAVESGEKGLDTLQGGNFNLALVDLKMPGMDGIELLKQIRTNYKDVEVIIITGYGTTESAIQAIRFGAYDFVTKPFDVSELSWTVKSCLEKKSSEKEELRQKEIAILRQLNRIITGSNESDKKLEQLLVLACNLVPVDVGSFMFLDEKSKKLHTVASFGLSKEIIELTKPRIQEELSRQPKKREEPFAVMEQFDNYSQFDHQGIKKKVLSGICLPLNMGERVFGVMTLVGLSESPLELKDEDIEMLMGFARIATLIIEDVTVNKGLLLQTKALEKAIGELESIRDLRSKLISGLFLGLEEGKPHFPEKLVKIGKIAQLAGVSPSTIRYYTEMGLLKVAGFSPGGYRLYEVDETLKRMAKIRPENERRKTLEEIKAELKKEEQK
jgi:CheY-like chemotaxis protein